MPVTLYCAWSDVAARLSSAGAGLRVDDDPATRQDVLESAAVEVNGYCQLLYSVEALVASQWVKHATRDIAVFLACTRRGNPAPKSVEQRYEKVIEALTRIQLGTMTLPDTPLRKAMAPVLSNQRVRQGPVSEIKTITQKSTGTPEDYTQHTDWTDTLDYSI